MKRFKLAEPYGPPYEKQTKSQLEGGKAVLVPGGALLSEGVTLRTFSETNTPQLLVRAQECFYDSTNHSVSSSGPLHMETADGKFSIEGEGFYWRSSAGLTNSPETNSTLIVSNKVHTVIQASLLQATGTNVNEISGGTNSGPLSIFSGQFRYDSVSGLGVWREKVQAISTNLTLSSAVLTAEVPLNQRQVRSLVAQTNVVVDYRGLQTNDLHATGDRLNYAPDSGLIRISDHATWQTEQRRGSGDKLIIDPTNRVFQVLGNARLKLVGQSIGDSGFLSLSNSPVPKSSANVQRAVEIFCDNYEIRTNWAAFRDLVRLEERLDNRLRSRMTCHDMTASFGSSNELQTMVAEKNVIIEQEDQQGTKRFTGGRAVYSHTNAVLEMFENPTWRAGSREGKGDRIRLNTQQNELLVSGNALLRLPANEFASQLLPTNKPANPRPGGRMVTNQFAEIYCQDYKLRPEESVFWGGVYATHPEMNWSCEKLTVQAPAPGLTNLVAVQNVVFDLATQKEGMIHGTGDRAVYTSGTFDTLTNGIKTIDELRLTGSPAVLTNVTKAVGVQDRIVIWNRATDKAILLGDDYYKVQGLGPPVSTTNTFVLPKKKHSK